MKIFIVLPYFPLPGTGTGNAVYGFAKGLLSAGANVCVLAEGNKYEESNYQEVPYIKFTKKASKNPFNVSLELLNFIEKNLDDIDLLILNGIYAPYMYSLGMHAKKLDIPYIHIPHSVYNDISFTKSWLKKKIYFKFFEKKLIENALAVQMLSETQINAVEKLSTPKTIITIPNGIDIKSIDIQTNQKTIEKGCIRIIFLGRKELFMKGLDLLINAFSKIDGNVELYIQGSDVGDTETLKEMILNINAKNIFLLEPFKGNIVEYLKEYDIFIMPSRYEGFNLAVIEAMLAGLPIIASKEIGAAFYVEKAKAGIICDSTSESIKHAIEEMLSIQDKWDIMGGNGKEYLVKNLTWETIGNNALIIYQELLKKNK